MYEFLVFRVRQNTCGLLLAYGADPTIADRDGATPLLWASDRNHAEITHLLLFCR